MSESQNPLKQIFNIGREEIPQALLMFTYFFLTITSFWILKPLKKGLFIQFYDETGFDLLGWHLGAAQAELIAKVGNMFVAFAAVIIFAILCRWFRRQQLTYIFSAFFIVCYGLFSLVMSTPADLTVWLFYFFGDLFSTLMVATFFAFLNDSVEPDKAKRLYGIIGLGGVCGGALGSTILATQVRNLSIVQWLWICAGLTCLIMVTAYVAGRVFERSLPSLPEKKSQTEKPVQGNPATEGARLVFQSRYLLSIVAIVGLYEMVSTIMDFQFTSTVAHYLSGPDIGAHLSAVFAVTNWVALFVQLFLASFVMTRYGVGTALLFLPVAAMLGSLGFVIAPVLLLGSALNTADNGFSYSINQSAKEVLYVPLTRDEKYKAKAFIDMFIQRFAKAVAVGLSLLITTVFTGFGSIRWLSLLTAVLLIVWIFFARFAGREFQRRESEAAR